MHEGTLFLETERLYCKRPEENLKIVLLPLFSNPNVTRYIRGGGPFGKEEIGRSAERSLRHWDEQEVGFYNLYLKGDDKTFIGIAGIVKLAYQEDSSEFELGYHLLPEFWGKGYATEVAKALVKHGFEFLEIDHLAGVTHKENRASQSVLKKAGFIHDREDLYGDTGVVCDFFRLNRSSCHYL